MVFGLVARGGCDADFGCGWRWQAFDAGDVDFVFVDLLDFDVLDLRNDV